MAHRMRLGLLFAVFIVSFLPSYAEAGPYFRLNPHKFALQVGPSMDTAAAGALVGGSMGFDYRVAHVNEYYSLRLGFRGHGTVGPVFELDNQSLYHYAGFLAVKFEVQMDSAESVSPYVVMGPGLVSYDGHPDKGGENPDGIGPALEFGGGVSVIFNDVFAWYTELTGVVAAPSAAYFRASTGLQISFGPTNTDVKAF